MDNVSDYDEHILLAAVASGDQKAFSSLVNKHWNNVFGQALAYTKFMEISQEITQDVFIKVWNKRSVLGEISDFRSYLFIMSRNEIISGMRKKLMETETDDSLQNLKTNVLPDSQLEYKEFYSKFMEAVEKLPPVRKTVFKMSRLEGKTYDEIAAKMSISKNTVKEHMVLALSFMRAFLHSYIILFLMVLSIFFVECPSGG